MSFKNDPAAPEMTLNFDETLLSLPESHRPNSSNAQATSEPLIEDFSAQSFAPPPPPLPSSSGIFSSAMRQSIEESVTYTGTIVAAPVDRESARMQEIRQLQEARLQHEARVLEAARALDEVRTLEASAINAAREAERAAQIEAERVAQLAAERLAKIEAERLAQMEAERLAQLEAEHMAQIEAERMAQIEADRMVQIEAERMAQFEAERMAQFEAERMAQFEAEGMAQRVDHSAPDNNQLAVLRELQHVTTGGELIPTGTSKDEVATILEGFARVLREGDIDVFADVKYKDRAGEITQLKELLLEAQETIIGLLNDRVFDRAKLAKMEAESRLMPDLQAQATRAMGLAMRSEEVQRELSQVRNEVERLRTSYVRQEQESRGFLSWLLGKKSTPQQ